MKGEDDMENIQYYLIHKLLVSDFDSFECNFNEATLNYLGKLKQAYDDFSYCVGKEYALNEIVDAYEKFYLMIDARVSCLFNVGHNCKNELQMAMVYNETFENISQKESFCLLRNYMFKLLKDKIISKEIL